MDGPTCPNCNRGMRLVRPLTRQPGEPQINVYECRICKVTFTTEDHLPIAGEPPP